MIGAQQCFVVFDVLMVNDTNLANCPLRERTEQLKKYVGYELLLLCQLTHYCNIIAGSFSLYRATFTWWIGKKLAQSMLSK